MKFRKKRIFYQLNRKGPGLPLKRGHVREKEDV
jgi:hypothetical protein